MRSWGLRGGGIAHLVWVGWSSARPMPRRGRASLAPGRLCCRAMGMFVVGVFFVSILAGGVLGGVSVFVHVLAMRKGRGSWTRYLRFSGVATVVVGVSAYLWMFSSPESSGAPSGDDYARVFLGAALLGVSPGIGLLAGLLTLLKGNTSAPASSA